MKEEIELFLAQKQVSSNSQKAYSYDLQQFEEMCKGRVEAGQLAAYQLFLQTLKPAVQKRKLSIVNQFLYYLYEKGRLDRYHKLQIQFSLSPVKSQYKLENTELLWQETDLLAGQLIALLITQLGLLPSEIAELKLTDIDLSFQVMTVQKGQQKRILSLPDSLLPYLVEKEGQVYLFDKKGQPYSRQWFFNRLSDFVTQVGRKDWTAQKLREQFILGQIEAGKSLEQIAKSLGLKSSVSLEKYR